MLVIRLVYFVCYVIFLFEQNSYTIPDLFWSLSQSYPHKILTGRRENMKTLRQTNGLSGFTKRGESEHDSFGTGHSSTTISAGLGKVFLSFVTRNRDKKEQ